MYLAGIMDKPDTATNTSQDARNFIVLDRSKPIRSDVLFMRSDEIMIAHMGEHYRLRRTRNGKLILTK